jgi:hypothetical protein
MKLSISDIEWACCVKFNVSRADMHSGRRGAFRISHPRQAAMYLMRTLTDASLVAIGKHFNMDHTTVIHAVASVKRRMEVPQYAADIAEIIGAIPSGEVRLQNDREWAEKLKAGVVCWMVPAKPAPAPDSAVSPYADPLARRLATGAR